MTIATFLSESLTVAKADIGSKKRALEFIAKMCAEVLDCVDADELFMQLVNREKLGSTGLGGGVAIPHCRFETAGQTLCACISLAKPIDFDSVDRLPVDLIFAMIVPSDSETAHLERLAAIAEALQKPEYVEAMRKAQNSDSLFLAATNT